jgi:hypothetical protein
MTNNSEQTTPLYWDCECDDNYIHARDVSHCTVCGSNSQEQPDSRINEVLAAGFDSFINPSKPTPKENTDD